MDFSAIEYQIILQSVYEMINNNDVEFPAFATEEMYVFGMTVLEAFILMGTMLVVVLTRYLVVPIIVGFVLWRIYKLYKEKGQANIGFQLAYRAGLLVPKSHLFPEPGVNSFRE